LAASEKLFRYKCETNKNCELSKVETIFSSTKIIY